MSRVRRRPQPVAPRRTGSFAPTRHTAPTATVPTGTGATSSTTTANGDVALSALRKAVYASWTAAGKPNNPTQVTTQLARAVAVKAGAAAWIAAGGNVVSGSASPQGIAGTAFDALVNGQLSGFEGFASNPTGALTGWVGDLVKAVLPILKIGAGGIGVVATGLALVYVAGRNTPVPAAAKLAVGAASGPAGLARKAVGGAAGRSRSPAQASGATRAPATPRRPDIAADRERVRRARVETAEAKARGARDDAKVSAAFRKEALASQRRGREAHSIKGPGNARPKARAAS